MSIPIYITRAYFGYCCKVENIAKKTIVGYIASQPIYKLGQKTIIKGRISTYAYGFNYKGKEVYIEVAHSEVRVCLEAGCVIATGNEKFAPMLSAYIKALLLKERQTKPLTAYLAKNF